MARRLTGVLIFMLLAFAGALPLTGVAHASEPSEEPVSGTCGATLAGEAGEPLTVDADAALGTEVLPAVRLASTSDTERRAYRDAVELPVGDVLTPATEATEGTGATDVVCSAVDTTADTANRVAKTTRTTLAATEVPETVPPVEPQPEPEPAQPEPGDTPGLEPPLDEVPAEGVILPTMSPAVQFGSLPGVSLPEIPALPETAAAKGPDLRIGGRTDFNTTNTGQAQALPGSPPEQPERAPFVLAVVLLAVVAAAFVRRWVIRSAT